MKNWSRMLFLGIFAILMSSCKLESYPQIANKLFSRCPDYSGSSTATGQWGGHWLASGSLGGYSTDQWNLLINGNNVEGCFESRAAFMGTFRTTISNNGHIKATVYSGGNVYARIEGDLPELTLSDSKGRKTTLTFRGGNQVASRRKPQASIETGADTPQEKNVTPQPEFSAPKSQPPSVQNPPKEVKRQAPKLISTGSGFVVSSKSQVLTNAHVVNDCAGVSVQTRDGRINARHIARDISYDLALIDLPWLTDDIAVFRSGRGIRPGDQIVVVGFPFHGLLSREPNVTIGNVSALAGLGNDRTMLQITAPVQPGNSGGPVLDMNGHVIGIVVGKLNAIKIAKAIGDLPQNVNFAINASMVQIFLDAEGADYKTSTQNQPQSAADIAAMARRYAVLVECWK